MDEKPKYKIDAAVVAEADRCQSCHRCLKDATFKLCRVDYVAAEGEVLFVSSDQCRNCGYQVPFGDSLVCACPVRKVIYRTYNI